MMMVKNEKGEAQNFTLFGGFLHGLGGKIMKKMFRGVDEWD